jgi:hypothetical protein
MHEQAGGRCYLKDCTIRFGMNSRFKLLALFTNSRETSTRNIMEERGENAEIISKCRKIYERTS